MRCAPPPRATGLIRTSNGCAITGPGHEPGTLRHMALPWRRGGYLSHAVRARFDLCREAHAGAGS